MRFLTGLMLVFLAYHTSAQEVYADGGTVRLMESRGDLVVTVFTSPTPFRVGDVDVSVLVQDKSGITVAQDVEMEVVAQPLGETVPILRILATREAATNKLLQAAKFKLPRSGQWQFQVLVYPSGRTEQRFEFEVEAAPELPPWVTFWPWFSWPAAVIVLFGMNQWLSRRKKKRASTLCNA